MNTCEATPSAAQEIRIQSLGTPEIDSPLSRNLATAGERRVVFTVDEELVDEGAAPRPMSFELAGPRDRIYFDPSKTKCAIVTCGGLCPGINDVIRAIVMTAYNAYRVPSVLGIRYGLQGFIPSYRYDVRELAPRDVEGIHEFGGTILGTSRGPQSSSEIATALERLNISALFIIGGDGTMKAAASSRKSPGAASTSPLSGFRKPSTTTSISSPIPSASKRRWTRPPTPSAAPISRPPASSTASASSS